MVVAAAQEFRPAWTAYSKTIWLSILTSPFLFFTPMLYAWWKRRNTTYRIDDDAVTKRSGGLSASSERINRDAINRISTSQSLFERLRNKGTVVITDTDGQRMTIAGVGDYRGLVNSLE
jgi:uncharacterized membrane protein YdbT with pleckstrin-like domain